MTVTLDGLKAIADAEGLRYFLAPDRPALLMSFAGLHGPHQVIVLVELDGRFVQFRTLGYGSCPASHPHLEAVLRVLGELDYKLRLTKFGWDPNDGEIVAYVDLWLEDATLTRTQFAAMMRAFLPAIDLARGRIQSTVETGTDPDGSATGPAAPVPAPTADPTVV